MRAWTIWIATTETLVQTTLVTMATSTTDVFTRIWTSHATTATRVPVTTDATLGSATATGL